MTDHTNNDDNELDKNATGNTDVEEESLPTAQGEEEKAVAEDILALNGVAAFQELMGKLPSAMQESINNIFPTVRTALFRIENAEKMAKRALEIIFVFYLENKDEADFQAFLDAIIVDKRVHNKEFAKLVRFFTHIAVEKLADGSGYYFRVKTGPNATKWANLLTLAVKMEIQTVEQFEDWINAVPTENIDNMEVEIRNDDPRYYDQCVVQRVSGGTITDAQKVYKKFNEINKVPGLPNDEPKKGPTVQDAIEVAASKFPDQFEIEVPADIDVFKSEHTIFDLVVNRTKDGKWKVVAARPKPDEEFTKENSAETAISLENAFLKVLRRYRPRTNKAPVYIIVKNQKLFFIVREKHHCKIVLEPDRTFDFEDGNYALPAMPSDDLAYLLGTVKGKLEVANKDDGSVSLIFTVRGGEKYKSLSGFQSFKRSQYKIKQIKDEKANVGDDIDASHINILAKKGLKGTKLKTVFAPVAGSETKQAEIPLRRVGLSDQYCEEFISVDKSSAVEIELKKKEQITPLVKKIVLQAGKNTSEAATLHVAENSGNPLLALTPVEKDVGDEGFIPAEVNIYTHSDMKMDITYEFQDFLKLVAEPKCKLFLKDDSYVIETETPGYRMWALIKERKSEA